MSDPFYRPPEPRRPPDDRDFMQALVRRDALRLISGAVALVLIVAIWLVWRWS